jgi:hypothetical protein
MGEQIKTQMEMPERCPVLECTHHCPELRKWTWHYSSAHKGDHILVCWIGDCGEQRESAYDLHQHQLEAHKKTAVVLFGEFGCCLSKMSSKKAYNNHQRSFHTNRPTKRKAGGGQDEGERSAVQQAREQDSISALIHGSNCPDDYPSCQKSPRKARLLRRAYTSL